MQVAVCESVDNEINVFRYFVMTLLVPGLPGSGHISYDLDFIIISIRSFFKVKLL